MLKRFFAFLCVLTLMCACSSPAKKAYGDLERLTRELEKAEETYTAKDWDKAAERFEVTIEEIHKYHDEYTDRELEEIGEMAGTCLG